MVSSLYTSSRPDSQVESTGIGPIPSKDTQLLQRPRASYLEQTPEFASDASRGSIAFHSPGNSSPLLTQYEKRLDEAFAGPKHPNPGWSTSPRKRSVLTRPIFWVVALVALIIVAAAVVLPVYFFVIKPHSSNSGSSGNSLTTGGNGSIITTSDGTTFTYINNFGGFCESEYSHVFVPWGL